MTRIIINSVIVLFLILGTQSLTQAQTAPPRSDTIDHLTNFLACKGNKFSLCYYSGPPEQEGHVPLPCVLGEENQANCKCYSFDDGQEWNYVAIDSILNEKAREITQEQCGTQGKDCLNLLNQKHCTDNDQLGTGNCSMAPVCKLLGKGGETPGDQRLYPNLPGESSISTFSFKHAVEHNFGTTSCSEQPGLYAGCMTAPCSVDEQGEFSQCKCPTYTGPFQVGQANLSTSEACELSAPNVWSAANVSVTIPHKP